MEIHKAEVTKGKKGNVNISFRVTRTARSGPVKQNLCFLIGELQKSLLGGYGKACRTVKLDKLLLGESFFCMILSSKCFLLSLTISLLTERTVHVFLKKLDYINL